MYQGASHCSRLLSRDELKTSHLGLITASQAWLSCVSSRTRLCIVGYPGLTAVTTLPWNLEGIAPGLSFRCLHSWWDPCLIPYSLLYCPLTRKKTWNWGRTLLLGPFLWLEAIMVCNSVNKSTVFRCQRPSFLRPACQTRLHACEVNFFNSSSPLWKVSRRELQMYYQNAGSTQWGCSIWGRGGMDKCRIRKEEIIQ